jgi:hypothetical protein
MGSVIILMLLLRGIWRRLLVKELEPNNFYKLPNRSHRIGKSNDSSADLSTHTERKRAITQSQFLKEQAGSMFYYAL